MFSGNGGAGGDDNGSSGIDCDGVGDGDDAVDVAILRNKLRELFSKINVAANISNS